MSRYIDAEALKQKAITVTHYDRVLGGVCDHRYVTWENVEEQPTEDVVPVVHAHWMSECDDVKCYYEHTCSDCGKKIHGCTPAHWKFCPHCGAHMDEKEENRK